MDSDQSAKPLGRWRRFFFGKPIATSKAHHERLGPVVGLAVFSSDALSSVAYATEAILGVLVLYSQGAISHQIPLTLAICFLITIIGVSYNQTIHAYPNGGGSYIVASENLGKWPGLTAGAALLVDYVLTVAVSVAAGVAAITSAFPALHSFLVPISLICVGLVAWANLRGMKESGGLFAIPTYGFVFSILAMIIFGFIHALSAGKPAAQEIVATTMGKESNFLLAFILMRAFAAGCTALTGIEAVSDGVQAFREPAAKNASTTLRRMVIILTTLFLAIGMLVPYMPRLSLLPTADPHYRTLVSQVAEFAFGKASFGFYCVQIATALILILAANTAFADFPRLGSFVARDGYLPRPFARQGDRLVFHNGIIMLALLASLLIVIFRGELDLLLPLYAVGVFTAFTLSQSGMVMHWWRLRTKGWRYSITVNMLGAGLSFLVLLVIAITKFTEGAWIVLILIPAIVGLFHSVNRRYQNISRQLAIVPEEIVEMEGHVALVLVPRVHRGILQAVEYAENLKGEVQAVHIIVNDKAVPQVRRDWVKYGKGVPLVVLSSPFRSLIEPVIEYVDELRAEDPKRMITVVVAEAVATKPWHKLLQENVAQQLKVALSQRRNVVVASVRYLLD